MRMTHALAWIAPLASIAVALVASPSDAQPRPPGATYGSPVPYAQPQYGQPQYGQPPYGYGQPGYGQPAYGQPAQGRTPVYGPWTPPATYGPPPSNRRSCVSSNCSRGLGLAAAGLRVAHTGYSTAPEDRSMWGGGLGLVLMAAGASDWYSARLNMQLAGSVTSGGLEGASNAEAAVGGHLELGDEADVSHGLFARVGIGALQLKNDYAKAWVTEFPSLTLGYTIVAEPVSLDIGVRGGLVLQGRYSLGDDYNRLDARRKIDIWPELGGNASLGVGPVVLDASLMRVFASGDPGTPIDVARGLACVAIKPVALCADAQYWKADITATPGQTPWIDSRLWYGGILVGAGIVGVKSGSSQLGR